jgi:hypothetical protein
VLPVRAKQQPAAQGLAASAAPAGAFAPTASLALAAPEPAESASAMDSAVGADAAPAPARSLPFERLAGRDGKDFYNGLSPAGKARWAIGPTARCG